MIQENIFYGHGLFKLTGNIKKMTKWGGEGEIKETIKQYIDNRK